MNIGRKVTIQNPIKIKYILPPIIDPPQCHPVGGEPYPINAICGNSASIALVPATIKGASTIPHLDTLFVFAAAPKVGDCSCW